MKKPNRMPTTIVALFVLVWIVAGCNATANTTHTIDATQGAQCALQGQNCNPNTEGEDQSNISTATIDPEYPVFLKEYTQINGQVGTSSLPVGNYGYSGKLSVRDSWGNIELGTFDLTVNFTKNLYRSNVVGSFTGKTPSASLTGNVSSTFTVNSFRGEGTILFDNALTNDIFINGSFFDQFANDTTGSFKSNSTQPSGSAIGEYSGIFYGDRKDIIGDPEIAPGYQSFLQAYNSTRSQFLTQELPIGKFKYTGSLSLEDNAGNIELGTFDFNVNFTEGIHPLGRSVEEKGIYGDFTGQTPSKRITAKISTPLYETNTLMRDLLSFSGFEGKGNITDRNGNFLDSVKISRGDFYGENQTGVAGSIYSGSYSGIFHGNRNE